MFSYFSQRNLKHNYLEMKMTTDSPQVHQLFPMAIHLLATQTVIPTMTSGTYMIACDLWVLQHMEATANVTDVKGNWLQFRHFFLIITQTVLQISWHDIWNVWNRKLYQQNITEKYFLVIKEVRWSLVFGYFWSLFTIRSSIVNFECEFGSDTKDKIRIQNGFKF